MSACISSSGLIKWCIEMIKITMRKSVKLKSPSKEVERIARKSRISYCTVGESMIWV